MLSEFVHFFLKRRKKNKIYNEIHSTVTGFRKNHYSLQTSQLFLISKKILLSTMTSIPPLIFQPIQFPTFPFNLPYHRSTQLFSGRPPILKIFYDQDRLFLPSSRERETWVRSILCVDILCYLRGYQVRAIKSSHNYEASDRCIARGETLRGLAGRGTRGREGRENEGRKSRKREREQEEGRKKKKRKEK